MGPPTSCDVLYYYESLKTATGRHRDAFSAGELHKYYTTGENPFAQNQYAQNKGTDVIIFTMGNTDMEMKLSFPETKALPDELPGTIERGTLLNGDEQQP